MQKCSFWQIVKKKERIFGNLDKSDPRRVRTFDPLIKSQVLYQLSYGTQSFKKMYRLLRFCGPTRA